MQKQRVVFGDIVIGLRNHGLFNQLNIPTGNVFSIHVVNLMVSRLSGDEDEAGRVIIFQSRNQENNKVFNMRLCDPVDAFYFAGTNVFRLSGRILQKGMNIE